MSSIFLPEADVDEMTGIRTGRRGQSKHELQCDFLRASGIPFIKNARGRPVVTFAAIEGRKPLAEPSKSWNPRVVGA